MRKAGKICAQLKAALQLWALAGRVAQSALIIVRKARLPGMLVA